MDYELLALGDDELEDLIQRFVAKFGDEALVEAMMGCGLSAPSLQEPSAATLTLSEEATSRTKFVDGAIWRTYFKTELRCMLTPQ